MKRQNLKWLDMPGILARKRLQAVRGQSSSVRMPDRPSTGRTPPSGRAAAGSAKLAGGAIRVRNATVAAGAGLLLYFLVAWLEHAAGTDLVAAVFLEEACKFMLLLGFATLAPKVRPRRRKPAPGLPQGVEGLIWGLAAIVVFATAENLAYFAAFPGGGIFLRLVWSEPVHLVSALAEAEAVWFLVRIRKGSGGKTPKGSAETQTGVAMPRPRTYLGMVATAVSFLVVAVAWHLAFNLAANGPIQALESSGDEAGLAWRSAILAALISNLAAMAALGYHFAHRVIVGGFLYGSE